MKESDGHTAELEKLTADIHQLVEYIAALDDKEKTKAIKDDTEKLNAQLDAIAISAPGAERADRGAGSDGEA